MRVFHLRNLNESTNTMSSSEIFIFMEGEGESIYLSLKSNLKFLGISFLLKSVAYLLPASSIPFSRII